jgi:hypothetical protein
MSPPFAPEMISTGKYSTYLVRGLVDAGARVRVVCSKPLYPNWRPSPKGHEEPEVAVLRGGRHVRYPKSTIGRRLAHVATAPVYHLHEKTWRKVLNRYEREAVDLQKGMPAVHVSCAGAQYCVRNDTNAVAKRLNMEIRCEGGGGERKPCWPTPPGTQPMALSTRNFARAVAPVASPPAAARPRLATENPL